jgi:hypothetical protein
MTRWQKVLTIGAAAVTVMILGWVIFVGAVYATSGVISIRIHERESGLDVYLPLPATMVEGIVISGTHVAGAELAELHSEIGEWAPMVRGLLEVLEESPDATFVEVRDGHEYVLVTKRGGTMRVEVDTDDVFVEVSAPIHMVRRTVERALG